MAGCIGAQGTSRGCGAQGCRGIRGPAGGVGVREALEWQSGELRGQQTGM